MNDTATLTAKRKTKCNKIAWTYCLRQRSMTHGRQAENHDLPLVRQQRRGGDEALRLDLQELEDPERDAKRKGGARPRGNGPGRQLSARGPGIHRAERWSEIQIHRSHFIGGGLRLAEGSGRSVDETHQGRRAGAVRLAQGRVRLVLADRSARHDRAAAGQGSREVRTRHAGDDADDQDRHRSAAAGASRRPRKIRGSVSVSMSTRSPAGTFACGGRPMLRYG